LKFILFVERHTEKKGIAGFLKRYLDPRLGQRVGMKVIRFDGWSDLIKDLPELAKLHLDDPDHRDETIGLIALLDLYGPTFYPGHARSPDQRCKWAKQHFEKTVKHPKFRMFFAVHEVEAWFLSDPGLFPSQLRGSLKAKTRQPERVNFDNPPKKLLRGLYREKLKQAYKEITQGLEFFSNLDPSTVADACPHFRAMLEEMAAMAGRAGLQTR
jgi:uncharacterized protein DUF4276